VHCTEHEPNLLDCNPIPSSTASQVQECKLCSADRTRYTVNWVSDIAVFGGPDTLSNGDQLHDDLRTFDWSSQTGSGVQYCRTYSHRRLSSVCGVAVRTLAVDAPEPCRLGFPTSLCSAARTRFVDGLTFEVSCVRHPGHALKRSPLLL